MRLTRRQGSVRWREPGFNKRAFLIVSRGLVTYWVSQARILYHDRRDIETQCSRSELSSAAPGRPRARPRPSPNGSSNHASKHGRTPHSRSWISRATTCRCSTSRCRRRWASTPRSTPSSGRQDRLASTGSSSSRRNTTTASPGALKNAIDFVYARVDRTRRPASSATARPAAPARSSTSAAIMAEVQVADVRAHVTLSLLTDFENFSDIQADARRSDASANHARPGRVMERRVEVCVGAKEA